ncbi:IS30 family transposase [Streptomyces sp. NPDC052013]|uniref:IS30 family transposase n=1 Tax=Streptomyces sp. NPDC052013 TaxID=3365679 RepID=UPI0037D84AD2
MSASANVLTIARSRSGLAAARLSSAMACKGRLSGAVIVLISFELRQLEDRPVAVLVSGHSLRRRDKHPDQVGAHTPLLRTQPPRTSRTSKRAKLAADPELKAEVQAKLDLEWSPEQIASHLRNRWPDRPERHLCHETIYRALYQGAKGGLSRTLTRKLRTGRPLRKKRCRPDQRMPRFVAPAVLIDSRPPIIELRERVGDWEGDLVVGVRSQSAVATLVDRRTRDLRLVPLPGGHSASHVRDALIAVLSQLPEPARRSLTWDHGSEMARHHELAPYLADGVIFARPGSPWQRGTNENTNGLLRQ